MLHSGDFLKGATIAYGSMFPDNSGFSHSFEVITPAESYWFTAKLEFAQNENDFAMRIRLFGALGRMSTIFKSFSAYEIEEIKKFLEAYLSSHDIVGFLALTRGRRPFALRYADDWVIEGEGELYEGDGVEFHRIDGAKGQSKSH
jgi:hypothetical protein